MAKITVINNTKKLPVFRKKTPFLVKSPTFYNKLSSVLLKNGKKNKVSKNLYSGLFFFKKNYLLKHICLFTISFYSIRPFLETKKVRKGSKFYDVPFNLKKKRNSSMGLRWIAKSIFESKEATFEHRILRELYLVIQKRSKANIECATLRTRVTSNMMFSHYRW